MNLHKYPDDKISRIISVDKKNLKTSDKSFNANSNKIISSNWAELLGIRIDSRLNFEPHVSDLYKSEARKMLFLD